MTKPPAQHHAPSGRETLETADNSARWKHRWKKTRNWRHQGVLEREETSILAQCLKESEGELMNFA
jgi:hypothetical protein